MPLAALVLAAGLAPAPVEFVAEKGAVKVRVGGEAFADYAFADDKITRPYFAHVRAPGGTPVTRNHPPVAGQDPTDHDTMHPGLWLAFGDLNKADHWRNKAKVVHAGFATKPEVRDGVGRFAVRNDYKSADGKADVCREECAYTVRPVAGGVLLTWDSAFRSADHDLRFGDQEEMGLGVRVATAISGKKGGRLLTSDGARGEKAVRGTSAAWCDYGGVTDGKLVGVVLMPHPKNARPSWYHARDYGLLVANPFGRKALTGGEPGDVVVRKGETLRLRFGVLVYSAPADKPIDASAVRDSYLALAGER